MKKNIWIFNHYAGSMYFNKGGRHYWFAKYLKRAGYNPVIFCCNSTHGSNSYYFDLNELWFEKQAEEIDVPFIFVKGRAYTGNGKQRVLNMIDFYSNVQKAAKQYAKLHGKPDVILASSVHPLTLVAGIKLAKYFGVKCICEMRDLWPESIVSFEVAKPNNPLVIALRRLEKWCYIKADELIFTMEGAYDYIKEQRWEKDIPKSKVHFINNGIDLEAFNSNKNNFQIDDKDLNNDELFKVVYAGSIRKANNIQAIVETAKYIDDKSIKLLIWGAGDQLEELKQRALDEKIENIVFKGSVNKKFIPFITSKADLIIVHYQDNPIFRFGSSSNKMFEAIASGRPTLFDYGKKYNPAIENNAGIVVENATPQLLAEAIEKTAKMTKDEKEQFAQNAHKTAEKYDFNNLTTSLINIIG